MLFCLFLLILGENINDKVVQEIYFCLIKDLSNLF